MNLSLQQHRQWPFREIPDNFVFLVILVFLGKASLMLVQMGNRVRTPA